MIMQFCTLEALRDQNEVRVGSEQELNGSYLLPEGEEEDMVILPLGEIIVVPE